MTDSLSDTEIIEEFARIYDLNPDDVIMMQEDGIEEPEFTEEARAKLKESMRQFDERLKLDKERLSLDKEKAKTDARLKEKALNKKPASSSK